MSLIFKIKEENVSEAGDISPISKNDIYLYDSFFKKELLPNYANNWAYITQACRNLEKLGYKFFNNKSLISIGYHNGHFVIVRPMGEFAVETTKKIASHLYNFTGMPVYLKHLSEEQERELTKDKDFINMSLYPWHSEYPLDDDTFPQVVIDLKNIAGDAINKPENAKIRLRVNRFKNFYKSQLQFIQYSPIEYPLQKEVALDIVTRSSKDTTPYKNMIENPVSSDFNFLLYMDEKPVGFYVFGNIGDNEVGCFANICDYVNYPGLCEAALIKVFNSLYSSGIEKVNLGGSEIENLHRFKLKFNPSELKKTSHLVYKPI